MVERWTKEAKEREMREKAQVKKRKNGRRRKEERRKKNKEQRTLIRCPCRHTPPEPSPRAPLDGSTRCLQKPLSLYRSFVPLIRPRLPINHSLDATTSYKAQPPSPLQCRHGNAPSSAHPNPTPPLQTRTALAQRDPEERLPSSLNGGPRPRPNTIHLDPPAPMPPPPPESVEDCLKKHTNRHPSGSQRPL